MKTVAYVRGSTDAQDVTPYSQKSQTALFPAGTNQRSSMPRVSLLLLSPLFSHVRGCRARRCHVSEISGQQGSNGLQNLLCLQHSFVGLGVTDVSGAPIIAYASQVRQRPADSAAVSRQPPRSTILPMEPCHCPPGAAPRLPLCQQQGRRRIAGGIICPRRRQIWAARRP